ncbi:hypothetical protein TTRE_0000416501 [Trichuris trichiura]|uniref:DUF7107 domain-containing protein n=1 Tax=Trichuris trichiura TaxID=36087 RepID=A0A077Z6S2_TRITR|nr:hypothetical protein TTRE_0000416501 [Trichuris trichiura]
MKSSAAAATVAVLVIIFHAQFGAFRENTPIRCRRRDDCTPAGPNDVFGYMCVRKTCVAVVRSNYSCRKRGRCGIGGRCMNGICYELWHGFTNPTTYLSDTDELPEYDGPDAFYTSAEEDQDDLKN